MNDLVFVGLSNFSAESREPLELLERSGVPYRLHSTGKRITGPELIACARDATVIIAGVETYDAALMEQLPALKCLSRCGVGVDAIDLAEACKRTISVANTPEIPSYAVAELALAMFLSLSRNLPLQTQLMSGRRWERVSSHLLMGRTVGLIGLGRIGRRIAELCRAFGANVIAVDPAVDSSAALEIEVRLVTLQELLESADIVSLHASKSANGRVLIGGKELAAMKPGSILVNLARGDMVDEAALFEALQSRHLSAAGLDVFPNEPYTGMLCDLPQVILTPHSATTPIETRTAMELQCVQNALNFIRGSLDPDCRVC